MIQFAIYRVVNNSERILHKFLRVVQKSPLLKMLDQEQKDKIKALAMESGKQVKADTDAKTLDGIKKVLADNAKVRWTIVAVHRPLWVSGADKNGFGAVEQAPDHLSCDGHEASVRLRIL